MNNENRYSSESVDNIAHDEINIKDLVMVCFQNRFWFGLSVIIFVALGVLFVKMQPNIYSRVATVIVEDDRRGGSVSEAAAFQEIFSMGGSGSVYNEMGLLESNRLMYEVVDRLDLEITYQIREKLRMRDLYNESPIKVQFTDILPSQYIGFVIKFLSPSQAEISKLTIFAQYPAKSDIILEDRVVNIGEPVVTEYGTFSITPTLFMNE
ncbi:MAG: Wzz/FepE/Etk N-terminal domain-containing protein, partial [Rikenellaceae bacterium]